MTERLRERRDALWSQLLTTSRQTSLRKDAGHTSPTWAGFSERFDRCFRAVCDHVNGRVIDGEVRRYVVTLVLVENIDLLIAQHDESEELERVRASADRLLAVRPDERHSDVELAIEKRLEAQGELADADSDVEVSNGLRARREASTARATG